LQRSKSQLCVGEGKRGYRHARLLAGLFKRLYRKCNSATRSSGPACKAKACFAGRSSHPLLNAPLQADFIEDWTRVCAEEAKHYRLLAKRLDELGLSYGDLPAHNGLWEAAHNTRSDIAARLAIAPMVLEARGLDVTPGMIKKLTNVGDIAKSKTDSLLPSLGWYSFCRKA